MAGSGNSTSNLGAASDEDLERLKKQGLSLGATGAGLELTKSVAAERKRRKVAEEKARVSGLEKQREETVKLLTNRPGRSATQFGGGGGNNPFSLN